MYINVVHVCGAAESETTKEHKGKKRQNEPSKRGTTKKATTPLTKLSGESEDNKFVMEEAQLMTVEKVVLSGCTPSRSISSQSASVLLQRCRLRKHLEHDVVQDDLVADLRVLQEPAQREHSGSRVAGGRVEHDGRSCSEGASGKAASSAAATGASAGSHAASATAAVVRRARRLDPARARASSAARGLLGFTQRNLAVLEILGFWPSVILGSMVYPTYIG